jgi:RNA polymerase sigma-70 factor (ECF subfamily)
MEDRPVRWNEREDAWRAWMIAAQAGDSAAYEQLLVELVARARRQVGARVPDVAAREDIVQNTLVSIHRARHTYRAERLFTPWFNAIVRNAIADWARARARRTHRELPLELDGISDPASEPTAAAADDALSTDLKRALEALPQAQRQAVELIHLEELSVAEAAERAGVSTGALKVRAHRGYRALRALLGKGDP